MAVKKKPYVYNPPSGAGGGAGTYIDQNTMLDSSGGHPGFAYVGPHYSGIPAHQQATIEDYFSKYMHPADTQVQQAPGYSPPSYHYDINSDPGVIAARAAYQQGMANLDSWLRGERTNAFVDFGDPNLVIPGFNVDANTKAMAEQNYKAGNAILARLDQAHVINARNVLNTLAAHGLIRSGDLGYRQGLENQAYGNNVYDARKGLLSTLNQDYQSYLDRQGALQAAVNQSLQNAYANAFQFMFS